VSKQSFLNVHQTVRRQVQSAVNSSTIITMDQYSPGESPQGAHGQFAEYATENPPSADFSSFSSFGDSAYSVHPTTWNTNAIRATLQPTDEGSGMSWALMAAHS
jgi:hypothetical protein